MSPHLPQDTRWYVRLQPNPTLALRLGENPRTVLRYAAFPYRRSNTGTVVPVGTPVYFRSRDAAFAYAARQYTHQNARSIR